MGSGKTWFKISIPEGRFKECCWEALRILEAGDKNNLHNITMWKTQSEDYSMR
jgi:hypothetical protein